MTSGPASAGLGNLIFERRSPAFVAPLCLLLTAVFLAMAVSNPSDIGGVALVLFLAAAFALFTVMSFRYRARVFEHGAIVHNGLRETTLSYAALETFAYAHLTGGGQDSISLTLVPPSGAAVTITANPRYLKKTDEEMAALREGLTRAFLPRLQKQLERHGTVEWIGLPRQARPGSSPTLLLSRDGYVLRAAGVERKFLFGELRPTIQKGWFALRDMQGREVFRSPCSADNFYPGLELSRTLAPEVGGARWPPTS